MRCTCVCVPWCSAGTIIRGPVSATFVGTNHFGVVAYDEELLTSELVHHVGQMIGVIVAKTRRYAHGGAGSGYVPLASQLCVPRVWFVSS